MKFSWLIIVGLMLGGCVPYKSAGRKCLEQSGLTLYEYHVEIGDAFASVQISHEAPTGKWVTVEKSDRGQMARNEEEESELLVTLTTPTPFNCRFRFVSAQELAANSSKAMDHCAHKLLLTIAYPDACQP